jgi:GT2 family glycosyltransferase
VTSPRVSFIVVTHARAKRLVGALESIRRQSIADREVIVVVNGPDPETQQLLRTLDFEVRVTMLDSNYGVGAGRNAGIAQARGEILFFLDDDAELRDPDTAAMALEHFDRDIDLGVVGLLAIDPTTGAVERRLIPFRDKRLPQGAAAASYFAGCGCVIHRRVFNRIGPFDESLFYVGEELDLSFRLLEAGFRILFDPLASVVHYRAGEFDKSRVPYFYARNRPWVALRHLPLRYWVTHTFAWWAWSFVEGCRRQAMGAALRGIRDCVAGMPGIWRERRPISRHTRRFLVRSKGRLWY